MKHVSEYTRQRPMQNVTSGVLAVLLLLVVATCAAALLSGCTLSPTTGATQETVAKAQIGVGAAYKTLNELFMLGKVSKSTALNYRARLVNAEDLLKQAEASSRSSDSATSNTAQAAAIAIINEVTQALAARKAAP